MNPNVKTKWLEALRSGDYPQGRRALHIKAENEESYCCLGVLCDLAVQEGVVTRLDQTSASHVIYGEDERTAVLPAVVQQWAGIDYSDPKAGGLRLSELNDGGETFAYIADRIERFL